MSNNLLEISNLTISFKQDNRIVPTIHNVNITLKEQEVISIVGESGSGKTVTCRSILGLVPTPPAIYQGGEIIYKGTNLLSLSEREWLNYRGSEISMVFQDPMTSLNPVFTIGKQMENVYIYQGKKSRRTKLMKKLAVLQSEAKERSIELLAKMKLPNPEAILQRYPFELSGGQRQRIIIALAMIHTPKILICDEPGTALDVTVQHAINLELKRLVADEGISMIFITHNLGVAKQMSERTYVMRYGEVVEEGLTQEVLLNPKQQYTIDLLQALPSVIESKKVN